MDAAEKKQLEITACKVRMGIIEGVHSAKSGHPGGSLSCADILTYLYFKHMNIDPANPKKADRDRFVLSKGHAAPALYATLANRGYFDVSLLKTLRQIGSILQGHPDMKHIPGVDMSTGSLGQGISAAVGMRFRLSTSGIALRYTPFWATVKLRKVRFGRRLCSPETRDFPTLPHLWITTICR